MRKTPSISSVMAVSVRVGPSSSIIKDQEILRIDDRCAMSRLCGFDPHITDSPSRTTAVQNLMGLPITSESALN
jgi:hypothetical protein